MTETVQTATAVLLNRYLEKLNANHVSSTEEACPPKCETSNLIWMINTLLTHMEEYPIDKMSRWLGFIQGVMAMKGTILVEEERDFSRPLFHAAYKNSNTNIPPTR